MPPALIAAAGVAAAAGGSLAQKAAADKATNTARTGQRAFEDIDVPQIAPSQLDFGLLKSVGDFHPNLEAQFSQDPSQYGNIQTDPRLKQAQLDALSTLSNIGKSNGLDAQSQAALMQTRQQNDTAARGQREAVLQNAAARGISGSGLELSAQLGADQSAADRNALAGSQDAAAAQQRKLAAIEGLGTLGGQMQGQDFSQQAQKAAAQDAINRFNTSNAQTVAGNNTQTQNVAGANNLATRQSIADKNVGIQNTQQQYNKELLQRQYQNQIARAQGIAGQSNNVANYELKGGEAVGKALGGLGQAGVGIAGTMYANQKQKPQDDYEG